jgi:hypothetical protein
MASGVPSGRRWARTIERFNRGHSRSAERVRFCLPKSVPGFSHLDDPTNLVTANDARLIEGFGFRFSGMVRHGGLQISFSEVSMAWVSSGQLIRQHSSRGAKMTTLRGPYGGRRATNHSQRYSLKKLSG